MKKELLFSKSDIENRVRELGEKLSSDYHEKNPVFIGVLKGVVFFFADLMREISIPLTMDFIRAASYGSGMNSRGEIRITKDVENPVRDRHVVVVEDIVDTGNTIAFILKWMEEKSPASVSICTLMDKRERRRVEIPVHYTGFTVESGFVVGYGLDYNELYRNLPEIYVLRP